MQADLNALFRQSLLFRNQEESVLSELAETALRKEVSTGSLLYLDGADSAGLWILEKGLAKVYKLSPEGQEYVLYFIRPGETFNHLAAYDQGPNPAFAMALSPLVTWVIPSAALSSAMQRSHALSLAITQDLTRHLRRLFIQVEDLALRSVTARLARFLLQKTDLLSRQSVPVTRAQLATHLATTPESISRSLRSLETLGAIRFDRHRILVIDPAKLAGEAQL